MRLKSEIWVHALLRSAQSQGHYGAVLRKGAAEAGAIFVVVNHLDGTYDVLGPPPGPAFDDRGERRFVREFNQAVTIAEAEALLRRRHKADPDLWEVEIEDRLGLAGLLPEKI